MDRIKHLRLTIRIILCSTFSLITPSFAEKSGWTPLEELPGIRWAYNEKFQNNKLFQCDLITVSKAPNGTISTIRISALQKGTIVLVIEDEEWVKRISMDFGWREGTEFKSVILHVDTTRLGATGHVLHDLQFLIRPNDRRDLLLSNFFQTETFAVSVSGLTIKAFNVPEIAIAWNRLQKCALLRGL
jgi:hypothetical protein